MCSTNCNRVATVPVGSLRFYVLDMQSVTYTLQLQLVRDKPGLSICLMYIYIIFKTIDFSFFIYIFCMQFVRYILRLDFDSHALSDFHIATLPQGTSFSSLFTKVRTIALLKHPAQNFWDHVPKIRYKNTVTVLSMGT